MDRQTTLALGTLALTALGCRFDEGGLNGGDGGTSIDAAGLTDGANVADAPPGTPDADTTGDGGPCQPWDWTPTNVDICNPLLPAPAPQIDLDGVVSFEFDTDTGTLTGPAGASAPASAVIPQPGGPDVRVVVANGMTLSGVTELRITGTLPVAFLVWGDVTLDGRVVLDGGPPTSGLPRPGAGADLACGGDGRGFAGENSTGVGGGGGAGGGGYGADARNGGAGHGPGKGAAGVKGSINGDGTLSPLRGGCSGAQGGHAFIMDGGMGGGGGGGGGAIQIIARDRIQHAGTITAAGGGGEGGSAGIAGGRAGGGGGGSGGAIFLETDVLNVVGGSFLCANGGSGGEGSDIAQAGANGNRGTCSDTVRATTTNVLADGGDGGEGGYKLDPRSETGGSGSANGGGGGGGGGVGRIRLRGINSSNVSVTATVSPTPTN